MKEWNFYTKISDSVTIIMWGEELSALLGINCSIGLPANKIK